MVAETRADWFCTVAELVGDRAGSWDIAGALPPSMLRTLGQMGLLCAEVPEMFGGLGMSSEASGELTAHVGSMCGSLRAIMTSQGMAAWTIQSLATPEQRRSLLAELTGGRLAAIGISERGVGEDSSTMNTRIRREGDTVVVNGAKMWMVGGCYADLLVVFGRYESAAAAVVVPATAGGVRVERVRDPLGCRAAGHAHVKLDSVRVPVENMLGGGGQSIGLLVTTALSYGRLSMAWGCVGILRACLNAASTQAKNWHHGVEHQLVARHLAEIVVAEQIATRVSEHASRCWDLNSADTVIAAVLAKHVSTGQAARGAAAAIQVMAANGAHDGHAVARAYRDAKLMEIIEGSNDSCQLILAQHALTMSADTYP